MENKLYVTKSRLPDKEYFLRQMEDIFQTAWVTNNGCHVQNLETCLRNYLGVDELILTDQHVPASAGLEPTIAITAQQDRRPRGMIENIILYDRLPRRAEQGTAGTVIPDHVIRE